MRIKPINYLLSAVSLCFFTLASYTILKYEAESNVAFVSIAYALSLLLLGAMFVKHQLKVSISLVMLSTFVGLNVAEFLIGRYLNYDLMAKQQLILQEKIISAQNNGFDRFDFRSPLEVVADLRESGVPAFPAFNPTYELQGQNESDQRVYPLSGRSSATTVYCNETGEFYIYESDQYGFNNPSEIWDSQVDTVLIGDSFVHGACLNERENIPGRLRSVIPNLINLGVGGNGPLLEYATLLEYLPSLSPRKLIWFYFDNDLGNLRGELSVKILADYLDGKVQNLQQRQEEIDNTINQLVNARLLHLRDNVPSEGSQQTKFFHGFSLESQIKLRSIRSLMPVLHGHDALLDKFRLILEKTKMLANNYDTSVYFVYLPSWEQVIHYPEDGNYKHRNQVLKIVADLDLKLIDMLPYFRISDDPRSNFWYTGSHYSVKGSKIVVNAVFDHVYDTESTFNKSEN